MHVSLFLLSFPISLQRSQAELPQGPSHGTQRKMDGRPEREMKGGGGETIAASQTREIIDNDSNDVDNIAVHFLLPPPSGEAKNTSVSTCRGDGQASPSYNDWDKHKPSLRNVSRMHAYSSGGLDMERKIS